MSSTTKSAELQEYDALYSSGDYSGGRAGYKNNFIRFIGDSMKKVSAPRPRILDIGCGDGFFTETLAKYGDVTATDFSEAGLERARQRLPSVKFFAHDLGQPFPLQDNSFDAAWCSEVLEHLFAPAFTAGEVFRVLKPGGIFMITVPYHGLFKNLGIALFAFEKHYNPEYPLLHAEHPAPDSRSPWVRHRFHGFLRLGTRDTGLVCPDEHSLCGEETECRLEARGGSRRLLTKSRKD